MKKILTLIIIVALAIVPLASCANETGGFNEKTDIGVTTREEGSGTRGAFVELVGILQDDVDLTSVNAVTTNGTSVMMTTVAGDLYSIGYISLGSMNDSVKAVQVDGAEATVENINSGAYKIARPFNLAYNGELSENAQDFLDFVLSKQGQGIVSEDGYIALADAPEYTGSMSSGKVTVHGSTSVAPVMGKIKEAYEELNSGVTVEIQSSGSSAGMTDAIDGTCDIGMASREVKDSEIEAGLTPVVMAMDGIAVIVHNDNPVEKLTSEQIMKIFTGETTKWSDVMD
ncbi:MAG: extracellular solute-binding protein [Clostridiales bacterium]|nr:extracellular solute-binding protein [Clostridiales bacterium]